MALKGASSFGRSPCSDRCSSWSPAAAGTARRRRRRRRRRRPSRSASSRRSPVRSRPSASASRTPSTWPSSRPTRRSKIKGWKIVLDAQDDTAKPDVGANAANKLASDPTGRRRGRHAQLQRRPAGGPDPPAGEHRPGLAGQHQPDADPGHRPGDKPAAVWPTLLPGGHHRPRPGPVRAPTTPTTTAGFKSAVVDPRQEDLRPGPGRDLQQASSRRTAARSPRPRPSNRSDRDFGAVVTKIVSAQARPRLLRRRVPGRRRRCRRSSADRGLQRPDHGRRRHPVRRLLNGAGQAATATWPPRSAPPPTKLAERQGVRRRLRGRRLQGGPTRPTAR